MGKQQDPGLTVQQHNPDVSNVLGDFYLENRHYWIICPETCETRFAEGLVEWFQLQFSPLIAGNVTIAGKDCLILTANPDPARTGDSDVTRLLTERELQIVQLVAQGYPNKQIARRLAISIWTVSTHLRRVFAKLGVDSRAAMVYRCMAWLNHPQFFISSPSSEPPDEVAFK